MRSEGLWSMLRHPPDRMEYEDLHAFYNACMKGKLERVKAISNLSHSPNRRFYQDQTLLLKSVVEGNHEVVRHLIASGADVNEKDRYRDNKTALHIGSERGHLDIVEMLLNAGTNIDEVDKKQFTPLMLAVRSGKLHVVYYLVEAGADITKQDRDGQTALHIAIESCSGDCWQDPLRFVETLLRYGAEMDQQNKKHQTPLVLSVLKGRYSIMYHLIMSGADVAELTKHVCQGSGIDLGREALLYTWKAKKFAIANILITKGVGIKGLLNTHPPMTALMLTVQEGHDSLAKKIILQGVNINYQNPEGRAALHFAVDAGRLEIVKFLLSNGAEIDQEDGLHHTPLLMSVSRGNCDVMLHLIKYGADVSQLKSDAYLYIMALLYTFRSECIELADILIAKGVGIEELLDTRPPMTALMWTAKEGHDSLAKKLILQGVNVNYQNPEGRAALHFAAGDGQLEVVKFLITHGAEIDQEDGHHHTPLLTSVSRGNCDVMLHLIKYGADVSQLKSNAYLCRKALLYTFRSKCIELADILIAKGVGIEELLDTHPPMTALMWTAQEGHDSLAKKLILQGVSVNYQNPEGRAALHFAAGDGHLEIVKFLLTHGAEIDQEDGHHHTPLLTSVSRSNYDVMLHLIKSGADVSQLKSDAYLCRRALLYTFRSGSLELADILIAKGVGIEELLDTHPPMTALMWTAQEGHDSLAKKLILQGVNINYQNLDGLTALHFAARCNWTQCGILLAEAGADVRILNKASQTPLDVSGSDFKEAVVQALTFQAKKTVCVIGNALSGKSTLIASLQSESANFLQKIRYHLFGVQNISERTAGIEPVSINSRRYGDVLFFDFAGQHEYHGPHEIFLESIVNKGLSTVTIIVVVKATEDEHAIYCQLMRWLHPFSEMSRSSIIRFRVIIIASHMDKVKCKTEAKQKLKLCCEKVEGDTCNPLLVFGDLCYLDCRKPYAGDMTKLCKLLNDVPLPQYKARDTNYSICWVISRMRSSISERVIHLSAFADWIAQNRANLPTNLPPVEDICKDLTSTGHLLYLPSKEGTSNGWLVLDLTSIIYEVYGTLFSPSKKIVNKFGLLNCQRLPTLFPTLDPSMVHDVLISLEFCTEVDTEILSKSINLMDTSIEGQEHLFFPALVLTSPPKIFNNDVSNHILCWQLEVSENLFISPRLLQTIILRLAAHHVFYHKRGSETVALSCNVWWNGIFWRSAKDVDVAVEITDNTVVQVLVIGRSKVSPEGLCKYLLVIVEDIFTTIHDLFPRLSGAVYMIHPVTPQMLLEKPRSRCPQEMFPIDFILESRRNGGSTCLSLDTESKAAICTPITEVFIGYEPPSDVIEGFLMSPSTYVYYIRMCMCIYSCVYQA